MYTTAVNNIEVNHHVPEKVLEEFCESFSQLTSTENSDTKVMVSQHMKLWEYTTPSIGSPDEEPNLFALVNADQVLDAVRHYVMTRTLMERITVVNNQLRTALAINANTNDRTFDNTLKFW